MDPIAKLPMPIAMVVSHAKSLGLNAYVVDWYEKFVVVTIYEVPSDLSPTLLELEFYKRDLAGTWRWTDSLNFKWCDFPIRLPDRFIGG